MSSEHPSAALDTSAYENALGTPTLPALLPFLEALAEHWLREGVQPGEVERVASLFAEAYRWSAPWADKALDVTDILAPMGERTWLKGWQGLLAVAYSREAVGNLALHLLDVAEFMAHRVFGGVLPAIERKSDRSGDAARLVGTARLLRG